MDIQSVLSSEFQTAPAIIGRIVSLIDEGNTIPFIARYRKEMTGAMDDQKLREISERLDYLRGLDKRREAIAASITEQGKMTDELEKKLAAAATLSELEDVYRPYKQKRRTRAMIAREKGVQPLADAIFAQRRGDDPLRPPFNWRRISSPSRSATMRPFAPASARSIAARACCAPSRRRRAKASTRNTPTIASRCCARRGTGFWRSTGASARNGSRSRWNVTTSRRCKSSAAR